MLIGCFWAYAIACTLYGYGTFLRPILVDVHEGRPVSPLIVVATWCVWLFGQWMAFWAFCCVWAVTPSFLLTPLWYARVYFNVLLIFVVSKLWSASKRG